MVNYQYWIRQLLAIILYYFAIKLIDKEITIVIAIISIIFVGNTIQKTEW